MLLATVVAILTCVTVVNATQTITTPNAANITYSLAVGANSAAITPASNKPVLVMGCCTTSIVTGIGQVSLLHIPSSSMQWVGFDYSGAAITKGQSATAGTHIVWIDTYSKVDIQVASADTIQIHNGQGTAVAGNVTLVW
jgi:hypothetical protein